MTEKNNVQICTRCVMAATVPGIHFDGKGECNYCHMQDSLEAMYPKGPEGQKILDRMAEKMRKDGRGRKYDCIVGVSGGRDTSYCLYYVKEIMKLRPLAVHFDNGWDSDISKTNLAKLCDSLDVDLHTVIMDWPESRDLTNVTIKACVPYIDLTDDIGIASALYRSAEKERCKYIILSHSFREEGVTPLMWNYIDGRYTQALIDRFGTVEYKHFQNVTLTDMIRWHLLKGIKVINITNYYDDVGQHVEEMLAEKYGWVDTGQHHMDNEMFALVYYYARHKFGFDWRVVELSAKVRTGVVTRQEALDALQELPWFENEELVGYGLKKQGWTWDSFNEILKAPNKYFTDYPSYYPLLKALKFPIWMLCRLHVVPGHAYEKFFKAV